MCNTCINDVSSVLENNMKNENICVYLSIRLIRDLSNLLLHNLFDNHGIMNNYVFLHIRLAHDCIMILWYICTCHTTCTQECVHVCTIHYVHVYVCT